MKRISVLESFIVTVTTILVTSIAYSEEMNKGFICSENHGLTGGGISGIKLELAQNNLYKMSYLSASVDGSNKKETSLGENMECKFSKIDSFVVYCISGVINEKKQSNYLKSTRNKVTAVNQFSDGTYDSYEFIIAAPTVDDEILRSIDPIHFNANQKSINVDISLNKALSDCKPL